MELVECSKSLSSVSSSEAEDDDNFEVTEYPNNNLNTDISVISDRIKEENRSFATNYENIDLVNSHNNHIGTKIIANNITLVVPNKEETDIHRGENKTANVDEETRIESKKKNKIYIVFCLCTLIVTMPFVISIITVREDTKKFNESVWLVTREMWGATAAKSCIPLDPYPYIVTIDQTGRTYCTTYVECCEEMRQIQTIHMTEEVAGYVYPDINYSFVIGGDGRVYEGRAWICSTQTKNKYDQLLSIAFVGDYFSNSTNNTVSEKQMKALSSILQLGIKESKLYGGYAFAPICCYNNKLFSPGDNLYNTIEETGNLITGCDADALCPLIKHMISNT